MTTPDAGPAQLRRLRDSDELSAELVVRGLVDGVAINDVDGRFLWVSPAYESLTAHSSSALIGRTPFELDLFHADDVHHLIDVQSRLLETGDPQRLVLRFKRSDGVYVWLEAAAAMADTGDDRVVVTTLRQAGQLESLAEGIAFERQAKQQLEEMTAQQQRFLTTVSHRARTPLTSVVGMAEILRHHGEALPADQRSTLLERLLANAGKLMVLLEDVTEVDRLTRQDVMLRRRVVNLHALVASVVRDVADEGAALEVDVDPKLRAVVDREKVARILTILLGNSFKHAGVGVSVRVTARATDDGVELLVDDDGPGIPRGVRDKVFEPFVHGDTDLADPGAGLGLHLVSELAGLHRGRAWVEDSPMGGARLCVSLPRPRADAPITGDVGETSEAGRAASALRPETDRFVTTLLSTLRARIGMDKVYLSVFDDRYQHILAAAGSKSVAGIEPGRRIPIEDTYCARMVADELDNVVGDTRANAVTADLPSTEDGLACWIGVPVQLPSGQVLGTLCCADSSPRADLSPSAAGELHSFAAILGDQLAGEGFLDGTSSDITGRISDVLTKPGATYPVYQPIVDLQHGTVAGVEALTRFAEFDRPVDLWFADAARVGLLVDLEILTAKQGLSALPLLPDDRYIAINVSPRTAQSRDLAILLSDQPLDRIVLEITEHAAVDNYQPLTRALADYRAQGLRVAIDDVGTGYAGLGHLVRLAPDIVKVDRSLVESLDTDPAHAAAVGGVVRMAEHVGARLVAEGIERPATLSAALDIGFSHAQGYLLARPAEDIDIDAVTRNAQQHLFTDPPDQQHTPATNA